MKRFVTRKKVRVPRYKILVVFTFFIIFMIIGLNIGISLFINSDNRDIILTGIVNNTFGSLIPHYKTSNYQNWFLKNVYGFSMDFDESVMSDNDNIQDLVVESKKKGDPLIYIYNTFQTSKYKSVNYHSYNINSLVTQASKILEEYLGKLGINSLVETSSVAKVLKDNNIAYTYSYRGSRILLEEALKKNSTLKYFLDIQISSSKYNTTTANIDGNGYAKVLFVVGTQNNNYPENQKLAQDLNLLLSEKNKNLSRGVSLRGGEGYHGVYNQDFSSNALLIEVGGVENTIEEVNRTMKILAQVLKEYMEETYEAEK